MELGDLASWVAVLLALGGSVAGGGYVSHVARTRHDDRRTMLTLIPAVVVESQFDLTSPNGQKPGGHVKVTLPGDLWIRDIRATADLLPYTERALTERIVSSMNWVDRSITEEGAIAVLDLGDYLAWKVNPTFLNRLRTQVVRVEVFGRGPRPWARGVRVHPSLRIRTRFEERKSSGPLTGSFTVEGSGSQPNDESPGTTDEASGR